MIKKFLLPVISALAFTASPAFASNSDFALTSPDIKNGATIGLDHVFGGCGGKNISPELHWSNAPTETKSFALTVYDPDAPTGSGWWHWVAYNIPATTASFGRGAGSGPADLPAGTVQGRTDYGTAGYGGPCPPVGDKPHRYIFTIYALKIDKIDVPTDASAAMIGFNLNANKIATASFTAMYGR